MNAAEGLDSLKIRLQLGPGQLDGVDDLRVFDCVNSTNDWALSQCQATTHLPKACFAEQQLKGRGRKDRVWYSPYAQNIYMSLALKFDIPATELYGLSLVVGICIVRVLNTFGLRAGIKWPNDVYVGSGKIAGVLVETRVKPGADVFAVIGVGLNYDMADTSNSKIATEWTDLIKEVGNNHKIDRNLVAGKILSEIMSGCDLFAESGFNAFHDEWRQYDLCTGEMLDIIEQGDVFQAEYLGVSQLGALMVQVNDCQKTFYAADVSIRIKE